MLEKGPMRWGLKIPLLDKAIYSAIRKKLLDVFGGQVGEFIVGGAALSPDTEAFLMKIKFPITVGYGMTETAPLISYTYWTGFKPGSVGRYLKDYIQVRIDSPDPQHVAGEIVVRGEQVMKGYYKNDAATAEVLRDGWLYTGDIGTMDPDGTLYIRGRSKTMILLGNGQNIYPEEIEAKLNNLYLVMESLIVEREGRLVALVYPDYDTARTEGVADEAIPEIMDRNLAELNTLVAPFERVSSIVIFPTEFEKTPKKSIRRYLYQL
jgi:long-chain acyl-CoA synthetase